MTRIRIIICLAPIFMSFPQAEACDHTQIEMGRHGPFIEQNLYWANAKVEKILINSNRFIETKGPTIGIFERPTAKGFLSCEKLEGLDGSASTETSNNLAMHEFEIFVDGKSVTLGSPQWTFLRDYFSKRYALGGWVFREGAFIEKIRKVATRLVVITKDGQEKKTVEAVKTSKNCQKPDPLKNRYTCTTPFGILENIKAD